MVCCLMDKGMSDWVLVVTGGEALQDSSEQWVHLAAGFEADISQQPALLQGGELRDYQMKVSMHSIACYVSMPVMDVTVVSFAST